MKNVGFIGIGKLGMPCAEEIAQAGHEVYGYDVESRTSEIVNVVDSVEQAVVGTDIIFIAVPTPHDPAYDGAEPTSHLPPKDFDYSIVKDTLIEVNKHTTKNQLVVLISTVLPGTTRREFVDLIPNARFVYNPYLIAMGSVNWDMTHPEMVMIGTEDGSLTGDAHELIEFYKTIMKNNPRYEVGTWDECECMKIFYNTFISAKIGLVNMIQDVALKQGNIDVDVVTSALARSDQRIMGPKYMTAGMGDGGACVAGNFLVEVNGEEMTIENLYNEFQKTPEASRQIKSSTYDCSGTDYKEIDIVTSREYSGNMYKFVIGDKELVTTEDHLIPVYRDESILLVKAMDVRVTDELFVVSD